jgi:hypothetical protein
MFIVWVIICLLIPGAAHAHSGASPDFNGDGKVDFDDFFLFAGAFGSSAVKFDLSGNGNVDFDDFFLFAQRFGAPPGAPLADTFRELQTRVFNRNCLSASCHTSGRRAGGLVLEEGFAYEDLVGAKPDNPAAAAAGLLRVDPGRPERSFLLTKLTGPGPGQGDVMPRGVSGLRGIEIDALRAWVQAGAPRAGLVPDAPRLEDLPADLAVRFTPPAPPERGVQLRLGPFGIPPGREREVFSVVRPGLDRDLLVNKIEITMPEGSHHFILYLWTGRAQPPEPGIRDFDPKSPMGIVDIFNRQFVTGSQTSAMTYAFPDGVGLRVPRGAVFDLNSHFVNLRGRETLMGEVYVNLHEAPAGAALQAAEPLFDSNFAIHVPPGQTTSISQTWTARQAVRVITLSSHMHRHGERFTIQTLRDGRQVYESADWDDPEVLNLNPPLALQAGDGLRYTCTHSNRDRDVPLRFGFTSEDEMCIMFGYYYR